MTLLSESLPPSSTQMLGFSTPVFSPVLSLHLSGLAMDFEIGPNVFFREMCEHLEHQ